MKFLNKQRNILDFTLSSLVRRKGKNLALVVVYTFVIFLLASVMFLTHAIKKEASILLQGAPEMTVQRLTAGRQDLIPLDYMKSIKRIRGVQSVSPRLWGYYYDPLSGANFTLMANADLKERTGEIIIGNGVSWRAGTGGGKQNIRKNEVIPFKTYDGSVLPLKVKGILPFSSELVTADLILVSEADFRRIFSIPDDHATDLVLKVRNPKELSNIATKIKLKFPDTRQILQEEILRTYEAVFDWRSGLIIVVLSGAFFAFLILAWDKATGLSGEEKREIGILKAIGWETSDILLMKFWEGAVLSLFSFILGIFLAYLHIFLGSSFLFEPVLKGWSVLYPHFRLTPYISVYQIGTLFFLTVIPYTVATILPSWRSAIIDPDSVMRS